MALYGFFNADGIDGVLSQFSDQIPIVVVAFQNVLNLMPYLAWIRLEEIDGLHWRGGLASCGSRVTRKPRRSVERRGLPGYLW